MNPAAETPWGAGTFLHGVLDDNPLWLWVLAAGAHVVAARTLSESISLALGVSTSVSTLFAWFVSALTVFFKMSAAHTFEPELLRFLPPRVQSAFTGDTGDLALWTLWSGLLALCILLFSRRQSVSVKQHSRQGLFVFFLCCNYN